LLPGEDVSLKSVIYVDSQSAQDVQLFTYHERAVPLFLNDQELLNEVEIGENPEKKGGQEEK
jgi:hypothetical protein